jgi:gas vesicle protein
MISHKIQLPATLLTLMLLIATGVFSHVAAAQEEQEETEDLPLGLQLTETLHTIIEEHKQAIQNVILEFKLEHEELIENKTELIRSFIEARFNRTLEIKEAIRELNMLYAAGNITREEYLARLSMLRSELKALAKSSEKLGKLLHEFASEMKEIVKEKVERLREINREFGKRVSEEAREIGKRMRDELRRGEESNTTTTTTTPQPPSSENRGRGRGGPHSSNTTATQTEEVEGQHRGNGHENRGRGHASTSTYTTAVDVDEEEGRGRGEGRGRSSSERMGGR